MARTRKVGIPSGGTTGQVLKKTTAEDYATEWGADSGGGGDVVGPGSSTNGAVVLYDGVTGKLIKNSTILPTTVGIAIANLANPSAVRFIRINADNSVTARTAAEMATDIGAITATQTVTLTNKRITQRTGTAASSATPTINTDDVDFYSLTAQAVDITSFTSNLSGTPTQAQQLWIAITGTAARAITWGASFEAGAATLPTTTVSTTRLDILFIYTGSIWRCMAQG